eukprot:1868944-Amphidinium_carterae.2
MWLPCTVGFLLVYSPVSLLYPWHEHMSKRLALRSQNTPMVWMQQRKQGNDFCHNSIFVRATNSFHSYSSGAVWVHLNFLVALLFASRCSEAEVTRFKIVQLLAIAKQMSDAPTFFVVHDEDAVEQENPEESEDAEKAGLEELAPQSQIPSNQFSRHLCITHCQLAYALGSLLQLDCQARTSRKELGCPVTVTH